MLYDCTVNNLDNILESHVPPNALPYCCELTQRHKFHFKLSSNRKSKLGDYKYDPRTKTSHISVNRNLNQYAFLITFVHEIAHLAAANTHGRRISPHGSEWKSIFKQLMLPLIDPNVFPDILLKALAKHLINPKASTHADPHLVKALQTFDILPDGHQPLDRIHEGDHFTLHGKTYKRMEKRRTRIVCVHITTDKKYLVAGTTLVSEL